MEEFIKNLIKIQERIKAQIPKTKRYFYYDLKKALESKPPLAVMLYGLRGVGKTVALLQNLNKDSIYFRADHIGFKKYRIYDVVEYLYNNLNIRQFMIDEIHRYEYWQEEIKGLYDDFPDIKIVLSGSSALLARHKSADLSRRLRLIHAEPMKFYEFVEFKTGKKPPLFSIKEIIEEPLKVSMQIEQTYPSVYFLFQEYMRFGGLPIYLRENDVVPLIANAIKRIIYVDVPFIIQNISFRILKKLEIIVLFIALSKPGEFSYETLASITGLSKGSVYELINALVDADLIHFLFASSSKSSVRIRKRAKAYFTHPTLRHALLLSVGEAENIGAYREEVFFHHIKNLGPVGYIKKRLKEPDFELKVGKKTYVFEVGKHKDKQGFINVYDSDKARYPLYMFGFLKS